MVISSTTDHRPHPATRPLVTSAGLRFRIRQSPRRDSFGSAGANSNSRATDGTWPPGPPDQAASAPFAPPARAPIAASTPAHGCPVDWEPPEGAPTVPPAVRAPRRSAQPFFAFQAPAWPVSRVFSCSPSAFFRSISWPLFSPARYSPRAVFASWHALQSDAQFDWSQNNCGSPR